MRAGVVLVIISVMLAYAIAAGLCLWAVLRLTDHLGVFLGLLAVLPVLAASVLVATAVCAPMQALAAFLIGVKTREAPNQLVSAQQVASRE